MRHADPSSASGRRVVAGLAGLALLLVLYLALGMPGMDHASDEMQDMDHPTEQTPIGDEP